MCHIVSSSRKETENRSVARTIEHQLSALQSLSSLLMKEEIYGLTDDEQDVLLAVVALLVLYNICETGVSSHGVHLTGAGYTCGKLARQPKVITSPRTTFLLTALGWLVSPPIDRTQPTLTIRKARRTPSIQRRGKVSLQ
ncbi:hypothetical protein AFLA70_469g000981 [Aspergillus flavus AF70]|nr:hypothetical protein AFLA70_469g000981 [Aspergillus flavus AF70]